MKIKLLLVNAFTLVAMFATPITGITALASDISAALYRGVITVTNNSTAATAVSVNWSCNTTALIAGNYLNATASNAVMRSSSGADIAFMPGRPGKPWASYVGNIEADAIESQILYTNATGGNYAIFPGTAGSNIADTAALEPANNSAANITALSPSGTYQAILSKPNSWEIFRDPVNLNTVAVSINSTSSISYTAGDDSDLDLHGVNWRGQTFTVATSQVFNQVRMYCRRTGNPGNLTISIYNTAAGIPTGSPLISVTGSANGFNLANAYQGLNFKTMFVLVPGTYAWVASCPAGDAANKLTIRRDITAPAYAGGTQVSSADSGVNWAADAGVDLLWYVDGTISAVGTANSAQHLYGATMDTANLKLYVDGVLQATTALGAATAPDNANAWKIAPTYFTSVNITVAGVQKAAWSWQYADTLTDTISGITLNPNYQETSSDSDVSAALTLFEPIQQAKAPAYTLDDPPDFISSNITAASGFNTSVNATATGFPLKNVIEAVAVGGQTPSQMAFLILFLFVTLALSTVTATALKNSNTGTGGLLMIAIVIGICFGLGVAIKVVDFWMMLAWFMIAPAILLMSRERGFG